MNSEVTIKEITPAPESVDLGRVTPEDFSAKEPKDRLIQEPISNDPPLGLAEEAGEQKLWAEIFSAGKHKDSSGDEDEWDDDDLDEIEKNYAAQKSTKPAPLVLGHPSDLVSSSPAYGWMEDVKHVGDKLVGKFGQLNKSFIDALKNGSYKSRSISLYPDNTVRHVGWLGAQQPAIAGLQPLSFEENKPFHTYSFTEELTMDKAVDTVVQPVAEIEALKQENGFFKKLFNMFKVDVQNFSEVTNGEATNKSSVAKEDGKELSEKADVKAGDATNDANVKRETPDPKTTDAMQEKSKEVIAAEKNEANAMAEENMKLKAKVTSLESELEALKKSLENKLSAASNRTFCEQLVSEGRLRPADLDATLENLEARAYIDSSRNFSEEMADSSVAQYKTHLKDMPKVVEFGEILPNLPPKDALRPVPTSAADLDEYIQSDINDRMKLSPNTSYDDAMKQAFAECAQKYPQFMAEYARAASCK